MKQLKSVLAIVGIVVKYGAVVSAFLKAVEVFHDEIKNIDLGDKQIQQPKAIENE